MKTVLVTGASSGIGNATARKLLQEGYTVYVAARRLERMRDLQALGALPIEMDVTREEDLVRAVSQITAAHGGIDILVNNAGFGMYGAMEDTTLDDARYQFDVNLFGLARLTQLALPYMRQEKYGKVVNISSIGGRIYTPLGSWYIATKHALEGWSDCLRLELAPFGIDVIIIEPGAILTEFGDVLVEPMLKRSGNTAYANIARAVAKATTKLYQAGGGSPPTLIADVIAGALKSGRPKTRYAAGKFARPLLSFRKWFGDRAFDKVVMSQVKTRAGGLPG
jgi:NAD(P)-dependent dehydrogenase (short-subunit alcohol dehydrogenase family)